jgi:leucyl/phenylalanyl-tRNA--protein transferase
MEENGFPYLTAEENFIFPSPLDTRDDIKAVGGNLSPGMLLSGYRQGLFPWYNEGEPILWWSLDPRFVLFPEEIHISRTMKRYIRKNRCTLTVDNDFTGVINACSRMPRPGQDGTWIHRDMIDAYIRLYDLGYAHSVECTVNGRLAGGLYGVSIGEVFFGESMFALEPNTSKAALIALACSLADKGYRMIDCQQHTPHLGTMGAKDLPLETFLGILSGAVRLPTLKGKWNQFFPDFPESGKWNRIRESAA